MKISPGKYFQLYGTSCYPLPQAIIRVGDRNRSQVKVHSVVNQYKFSQEMFSTIKVNLRETMECCT